jgi:hypothetical protein
MACAMGCAFLPASAISQYMIDAHAFDSAGASVSSNACSHLTASIGQAATGFSIGGGFDLSTGFQAIVASDPGDSLFSNGFEECRP